MVIPPDKQLLELLSEKGIGIYSNINALLFDILPNREDEFTSSGVNDRIWTFLDEMKRHGFIMYQLDLGDTDDVCELKATIQPKGREYLRSLNEGGISVINISGSHNQVIGQSSSSNISSNVEKNPITQTTNSTIDKKPKIRLTIEMIAWIVGIIISLIGIWQFVLPLFTKDAKEAAIQKQTMPDAKKEPAHARHVDVNDILRVKEFSNNPEEIIDIHFLSLSSESTNFANELKRELDKHYKEVALFPSNDVYKVLDARFMITREPLKKTVRIDIDPDIK